MSETIQIQRQEYEDLLDYAERLQETVDVLSNKATIQKVAKALARIESGKYLTKKDLGL